MAYHNGRFGRKSLARQLAIVVYSVWHNLGTLAMQTSHYMMPILFPHEAASVASYIDFLIMSRAPQVLLLDDLHEIRYAPSDISLPDVHRLSTRDDPACILDTSLLARGMPLEPAGALEVLRTPRNTVSKTSIGTPPPVQRPSWFHIASDSENENDLTFPLPSVPCLPLGDAALGPPIEPMHLPSQAWSEATDTSIVAQWDSEDWILPINSDTIALANAIDALATDDVAVEHDTDTTVTSNITETLATTCLCDDAKRVMPQNFPKKKKTRTKRNRCPHRDATRATSAVTSNSELPYSIPDALALAAAIEPHVKDALTDLKTPPSYEIVDDFEILLRAQGYGPANGFHSRWPPVPWQEAIKTIHFACKHVAKDFSKGAVLLMAEDYVQYNYLSVDANKSENVPPSTSTSELPGEASSSAASLILATHTCNQARI